ncbi:MAG TPA: MFS transporter [Xanthobacteraceae bacterium]|nr:MFS transporter [Xanthobacteraceae bacterium]
MTTIRPADDFALRLAVLYASLFLVVGIQFPFFPLWLKARGLDAEAIGIVLAVPIVMRIIAVPLINRAVDRAGDLRRGLIAASCASVVGFAFVGFSQGFIAILLAVAFASVVSSPIISLADAYALKGLNVRRRAYGPVRLWGSIAFIVANLVTGVLLTVIAADRLIWLIVAAFALLAMVSLGLRRPDAAPPGENAHLIAAGHFWGSLKFLTVAAAASLIQASHALYYGFSAVDWTAKGISSTSVGLLWGLGVVAEILLFAWSSRLAMSPATLLAIGAAGATIRWIVMAFDPPMALLTLAQCLHGLSFGATHLGAIQFVSRMAGDKRAAAAQGDFATILAIGNAAATGASGLLYAALGNSGYVIMAAMAVLGGACLLPALTARGKS